MYVKNVINPILGTHYKTQTVRREKLIVSLFLFSWCSTKMICPVTIL